MYSVAVRRDFIGQHYLIGGDWGAENQVHSHHFTVEVELEGAGLDEHGYLVDITVIEAQLNAQIARYRDHVFNDLPEFAGLNPSIERLAAFMAKSLCSRLPAGQLTALTVRVWENDQAWAAYKTVMRNS
jgi:6-pyruvoyltetrahydropterin/6-carboxytetrahydropterin synthase